MAITWSKCCQSCSKRLGTVWWKRTIVYISTFLLVLIVFLLILDIVSVFVEQKTEISSQSYSVVVLGIHSIPLFLSLLGFTFFNLPPQKDWTMVRWSAAVVVFTLLLSVARIVLEILTLPYRREVYWLI